MPPAALIILSIPIYLPIVWVFGTYSHGIVAGAYAGYLGYDMVHYYLHHGEIRNKHLREMKKWHVKHHYVDPNRMFGITSKVFDWIFGTM